MTRLILIRHGESIGNQKSIYLGHLDWDLTEKGRAQAEATAELLKNEKIDVVYSSDLLRAYNTAKPIADSRGLEVLTSEKLREVHAGLWQGMYYKDIKERFPESWEIWKNDRLNGRCDGGESEQEVFLRVKSEIDRIIEENKGKTILIATHSNPIIVMLSHYNGLKTGKMTFHTISNASISIIDYDENGVGTIVCEDASEHLATKATKAHSID